MALNNLNFLEPQQDWPPKGEAARLRRYDQNEELYESDHEKVFKDMWTRAMKWEDGTTLHLVIDLFKRLSNLWADLVAGEAPDYTVGDSDSPHQKQLDAIVKDNEFNTLVYDIVIDASRFGDALFRLRKEKGKAVIEGQSPKFWFPVTAVSNVRTIKAHVLAWPFDAKAKSENAGRYRDDQLKMLKIEIHRIGEIEHRVVAIGKNDKISHREHVMDHFQEEIGDGTGNYPEDPKTWGVIEKTGVDDFLVQRAPNLLPIGRRYGLDDYKPIEGLVQEQEARLAQISKILDKHSDPGMYGPASAIVYDRKTNKTTFIGEGKYYPIEEGEAPPGYIIWDAQLAAAFQQLEQIEQTFYTISETSPAAFGQADATGLAPSGTALRRQMQAALKKAERLKSRLDPVVRKTLVLALQLENVGKDIGHSPEDDEEQAA